MVLHGPAGDGLRIRPRRSDTRGSGDFSGAMLERGIYLAPSQFEAAFVSARRLRKRTSARRSRRRGKRSGLIFGAAALAFSRSATSLARNFAMRPINFTGTGWDSGKRIGALIHLVRCKLILERRDHACGGGIERVVLLPPGEIEHRATVQFVRGDLIRDYFLGSRTALADGVPHAREYALRGLGLRGNVFVHGLEVGLGIVIPVKGRLDRFAAQS